MFAIVVGSGFNPDLAAARPAGRPSTGSTTTRTAAPSRPAPAPARPAPAPAKAAAPSGAAIQPRQNTGAPNSGAVAKPSGAASQPRQNPGAPNSGAVAKPSGAASQPRQNPGAPKVVTTGGANRTVVRSAPAVGTSVPRVGTVRRTVVYGGAYPVAVYPRTMFYSSYPIYGGYYSTWWLIYDELRQARTEGEINRLRGELAAQRAQMNSLPLSSRPANMAVPEVPDSMAPSAMPVLNKDEIALNNVDELPAQAQQPVVVNVQQSQPKKDEGPNGFAVVAALSGVGALGYFGYKKVKAGNNGRKAPGFD
jgi:hypothetical protein